jgi:hypothetical protein
MMSLIVAGAETGVAAGAFSSTVLACSTAGLLPFVPTLMASTPGVASRAAGTFTAGQTNELRYLPLRGSLNPSAANAAAVAPAGQRPREESWRAARTRPRRPRPGW